MTRDGATEQSSDLQHLNEVLAVANHELRDVNEALVIASSRYLALHDLSTTPFITIDQQGQITEVNRAAEALLAASRKQLLGRPFEALVDAAMQPQIPHHLEALFSTGTLTDLEMAVVRDGAPIAVLVDGIVLPEHGPRRAVLACIDITERKLDEAAKELELRRAEGAARLQSLGVLAGGVAHDFNNLMTVVLAGADYLLEQLEPDSPHIQPLTEIRQAARHAGDLAHQMLAYSGHVTVPAHPVDLVGLVRELEPLLHASAKSTPVELELADQPLRISGNEAQLRQVLLNLVVNAAEAMVDRPGVITVAVRPEIRLHDGRPTQDDLPAGSYVVAEVRDAGIGMDEATRSRIFDPYYSTKFAGRGLGLAVVYGLVRAHGGVVRVDSAPGRGTTVRIHLRATPDRVARGTPPVELAWRGVGTVLLVDDDAAVRRAVARTLQSLGLEVVVASSAEEALALSPAVLAGIAVAITDLTMPGMNGRALARALHERRADLPIVLISGYGETQGAGEEFAGSLTKPFETSELCAALQNLVPPAAS